MAWFDFLGDIDLGDVGGALTAAGQLAPLFTSSADRQAANTPQFATRPMACRS